jgi:hypothetical protein
MRLQEIKQNLEKNIENLQFIVNGRNDGTIDISNYQNAIKAVEEIAVLGFIKSELQKLKSLDSLYYNKSTDDRIIVNSDTYAIFQEVMTFIKEKSLAVFHAMDLAIPNQDEFSVSIKLPNYGELDKLPSFFNSLDKSLNQSLVNSYIGGNVTIQAFDSGSFWVVLSVGSIAALKFLGKLTDVASKISTMIFDIKKENLNFEKQKASNDFINELNKLQVQRLNSYITLEAKALMNSENIEDPEYLARLQFSIKEIAELIFEGTQIYPNKHASAEDIKYFPDFTKLSPQIESQQKQIQQLQLEHRGEKNETMLDKSEESE